MIQDKKRTTAFIAVYFIFFAALLIIGSFKDFEIEKEVFNERLRRSGICIRHQNL